MYERAAEAEEDGSDADERGGGAPVGIQRDAASRRRPDHARWPVRSRRDAEYLESEQSGRRVCQLTHEDVGAYSGVPQVDLSLSGLHC